MVKTRSNRMGDWRKCMAIGKRIPVASTVKAMYSRELETLNSLPRIDKDVDVTVALHGNSPPLYDFPISNDLIDTVTVSMRSFEIGKCVTVMYPETRTPTGFQVELLPHQKRGLTWMLSVEDETKPILVKNGNGNGKDLRVFGGILADKPGTGKSILIIALLKSNPCRFFFDDGMNGKRTRSKATLLLCPRNIVDQWTKEIERCDKSIRVLQITTSAKLCQISSVEVGLADVIILPYYLLADPDYILACDHVHTLDPPPFKTFEDASTYKGYLSRFHFHRIVYDEVHEIYDQTKKHEFEFVPFMETFHSNWRWGISGTPPKNDQSFRDIIDCIAGTNMSRNNTLALLKTRMVRSSNPDLNIPGLTQEVKWIDLSVQELGIYNLFRHSSVDLQLIACSHFNVNPFPHNTHNTHPSMTIDQVSRELETGHTQRIQRLENEQLPLARARVKLREGHVDSLSHRIKIEEDRENKMKIQVIKSRALRNYENAKWQVSVCLHNVQKLRNELRYYKNILSSLEGDEEQVCSVCFEEFDRGQDTICLTGCGHVYCENCIVRIVSRPCPTCREPIVKGNVMRIRLLPRNARDGCEMFGSKLHQVAVYIASQISLDPTFKFIIFVQYAKLATLVTKALQSYFINSVNLHGAVTCRTRALNKFNDESGNHPVLLMSAEESVTGVNITAASHVIILHPFNLANDDESVAAEEQGIARAHRLGQTRPVRVLRFVTRGTVEETITLSRIRGNQIEG